MRSHYWGALVVAVASGDLDGEGAERLGPYLRRLQGGNDLIVDLWDVVACDPEGVAPLQRAKDRADEGGWGFAVVVDPAGPCSDTLEAAGLTVPIFHDRHTARAALQQSLS